MEFRDRFTGRKRTGRFIRTLDNGNHVVGVMTKMARGGNWYEVKIVVKPSQVLNG